MALLTAQTVVAAGVALEFDPASVGGDTFRPTSDRAKLVYRNDSVAPLGVNLATPGTVLGLAIADRVVPVPAGAIVVIPVYRQAYAHPTTGLLTITYPDGVTDLDVAVIDD